MPSSKHDTYLSGNPSVWLQDSGNEPPTDPRHRKLWAMGFTEPERDKIISVAEKFGFSILSLGSFLAYPAKPFEILAGKMEWVHFTLRTKDYLKIWACIMVVILMVMGMMHV